MSQSRHQYRMVSEYAMLRRAHTPPWLLAGLLESMIIKRVYSEGKERLIAPFHQRCCTRLGELHKSAAPLRS